MTKTDPNDARTGVALLAAIVLVLAMAALWARAVPEGRTLNQPAAPTLGAPAPAAPASVPPAYDYRPDPAEVAATPSPTPGEEGRSSFLGSTRGQAALDLLGPNGTLAPKVTVWVSGTVLGPDERPLGGAEVLLRAGEEVLARGEAEPDGSFSLEVSYQPSGLPGIAVTRELVARRAYQGGFARAHTWVRLGGKTRGLKLQARVGFDLELQFPFSIRSEVLLGRKNEVAEKLSMRLAAPVRKLEGLAPGPLWIAVLGVDNADGWWAAKLRGKVGEGLSSKWEVALEPLAEIDVRVLGVDGQKTAAKLVFKPGINNRFRESSLQRWSQGTLSFEEDEEEGPALPDFGLLSPRGRTKLRLPPGPWSVWAYGPPGTSPSSFEFEVGVGRKGDRLLPMQLEPGKACEFDLPAGITEGEIAVHAPSGAYLEDLGEGRWRVGGLAASDAAEVFLLHAEALPESSDEEGEGPLAEDSTPTHCARLRLKPGAHERLSLVRTATLRVLLPKDAGDEDEWEVSLQDAGVGTSPYSLCWDLEDAYPLEGSDLMRNKGDREQSWLEDQRGAMTMTNFERMPGRRVRSLDIDEGVIRFADLYPGPLRLEIKGPGGLSSTRSVKLVPGEERSLQLE